MNKQQWITCALEQGFESFEIYQEETRERTVTWLNGKTNTFVTSNVTGTSLRGVINGKMTTFATENPDDQMMGSVINSMKNQAAVTGDEEPGIIRRPQESNVTAEPGTWVRPSVAEITELLSNTEKKILAYDPRIIMASWIGWSEETSVRTIVNSYGMQAEDRNTVQILMASAAAKEGNEVKNTYESQPVREIGSFDLDQFIAKVCDTALNKLNASSLPSNTYPVIFERGAMTSLFSAFSGMFSGEMISKGISPLNDKLGTKIFSEKITVIDDPGSQETVSMYRYDDEGCPTFRKTVVDQGVFRTILHNSASAAKMNAESTGNGFKASYASTVGVHPMNCCIQNGDQTLDELCSEMKNGFVITDLAGLHAGIDFVTTNFSLQCSGYWVKDGVRDHSVSLVTTAGNFLEMMKDVTAVGNDLDWGYRSTACPSIAFGGCAIAGE
ncbi:MAG TPA: TldD/PmbA family protein [Erysipelotrichaceae bacterium]|nr:TldD/PmbA family protein [Erysipelotrichaceae bacterium]